MHLIVDTFPATPNPCAYFGIDGMELTDCKDTRSKTKPHWTFWIPLVKQVDFSLEWTNTRSIIVYHYSVFDFWTTSIARPTTEGSARVLMSPS